MKNLKKYLALLLTGVLLTSLLSCGDSSSSGGLGGLNSSGGSDEDLPYSPSEFYDSLLETEDLIVSLSAIQGSTVTTLTYYKDGAKVRLLSATDDQQVDDDFESISEYYDFDAELVYEWVDGNWESESITGDWEDIVESIADELPVFDDSDYEQRSGAYWMKESALDDDDMPEEITSVSLGFREDIAFFTVNADGDIVMLQAEFVDVTVTLPEGDEQGSVTPDRAPILIPPTIDEPDDPDPDPDPDPEPDPDPDPEPPTAAYMKPSELCEALYDADHVTIAVQSSGYYAAYSRDGDLMEAYVGTNENDGQIIYIDFAEGVGYVEQNGSWVTTSPAYISWGALLRDLDLTESTFFFIDPFYDTFTEGDSRLSIRSEMLDSSSLTSVTLEREADTYTILQEAPDGSDVTFVFSFEDTNIDLPV